MGKRKSKPRKPEVAKFRVGNKVRVKHGITDVDYPDMPMGGWAGTVTEVQGADTLTIRWSEETLEAIHPVFKNRCEIDGLDLEEYVLTGDDLEPDTGGPLDIEHPTEITTKPLSPKDEDDRVRMVFGLTSNDPLPDVNYELLEQYHEYLREHLSFPLDADYTSETGPFSSRTIQVKVTGLDDPDEPMIDDTYGNQEHQHTSKGFSMSRNRLPLDALCPCGSDKKYGDCCHDKDFEWLIDDEGNVFKSIPFSEDLAEVIEEQRQKFVEQHGREPGPDDSLFFDMPPLEHAEHFMVQAMEQAGLRPAFVYAFEKTGRMVTEQNQNLLSEKDLAEWEAAIQEYEARQDKEEPPQDEENECF